MARTAHIPAVLVAAVAVAMSAGRAEALSCLRPSVESSFTTAQASSHEYVMAVGSVILAPGQQVPDAVGENVRSDVTLDARFTGDLASAGGFVTPADMPLALDLTCAGPWCATPPAGEVLAFIQRDADGGHRLTLGPCPQFALGVQDDTRARALACLRGGSCAAP